MIDLPVFAQHSSNLWDYIKYIPYMPGADDRKLLEEKAARDISQVHRVQLWDYFFRPKPEDVGKPLRDELANLRVQAGQAESEAKAELSRSTNAIDQLEKSRSVELASVSERLLEIETTSAARERAIANKKVSIGSALVGIFLLSGIAIFGYGTQASSLNGADGLLTAASATCLTFVWVIVGAPLFFLGTVYLYSGKKLGAPERIQSIVASQQAEIRSYWLRKEQEIAAQILLERSCVESKTEVLERLVPHLRARIDVLVIAINNLVSQIPQVVSEEKVEEWLVTDLEWLANKGQEELGIEGQTINLQGTTNPFLIRGPAEIQRQDLIPKAYRANSERAKYTSARRLGFLADGKSFQHFAVFYQELLFITGPVLARYSAFYDFVRGVRLGERAPQQHFSDVSQIEMRREPREVVINDKTVELERSPSMILTLDSGDQVAITLPGAEYFEKIGAVRPLIKREGREKLGDVDDYDAEIAADSALRAITHCVNEAKRNLEIGQLARMKEAEKYP